MIIYFVEQCVCVCVYVHLMHFFLINYSVSYSLGMWHNKMTNDHSLYNYFLEIFLIFEFFLVLYFTEDYKLHFFFINMEIYYFTLSYYMSYLIL